MLDDCFFLISGMRKSSNVFSLLWTLYHVCHTFVCLFVCFCVCLFIGTGGPLYLALLPHHSKKPGK